ncbi:asparagine synthase-related protein [Streptomyces sp. XC 2026]|uniref:asparagine synthase-related protein n=1 Tax=Streptomyces sp. XC 2026 TaxID=2782004 RepID=UPI0019063C0F|nr:asparagine synthase-related protein [Streptomyces sp. XC 2026]QQN79241.1 asparagine synthase [Streptomyces sp. XC 2026]
MLTLLLTPYSSTTWTYDKGSYRISDSTSAVTPYEHPLLEHLHVTDGERTLVIVRERVAERAVCEPGPRSLAPAMYDQAREAALRWPTDYVLIETAPNRPVRVTAGAARTTPLYLSHQDGVLHGSWEMSDLRRFAGALSPKEAARLLTYRPRYGTQTLFTGIQRLTERGTAIFGGDLHLHYPEPALHSSPRPLAPEADVLAAFTDAMDQSLDLRPLEPESTVFHLTGGFDSGTIATRAAQRFPGLLNTAALLVIGAGRDQQIRRRREMRSMLPFGRHDHIIDCLDNSPLHPDCARVQGQPLSPYEEPLHLPFSRLTALLRHHGARSVVTGLGGDEMVSLSPQESAATVLANAHITDKLPWLGPRSRASLEFADDGIAPPAQVNSMTLLSLETTAPPLLRAGIWPLHPFTSPAMIRLGEELPLHWREFKALQRRQLDSLGLSHDVTRPVERESFVWLVQHSLRTYGAPLISGMLQHGSPLFDTGLVDPDGLRLTLRELTDRPYDEEFHAKLLQVIDLHLAARAFLT